MLKAELRKIYIARQKTLSPSERFEKSRLIAERFFQSFDLRKVRFLHCFLSIKKFNEIDTGLIFQRIEREFPNIKTYVPRVNFQSGEIENLRYTPETRLVENQWNIHEPAHDEKIDAAEIDLVLVPLLCFDTRGFRVGYGKGFYDKFLKNCRAGCLKIGLSYFPPIARISDAQSFDVKLDFCVTPEETLDFQR